MRSATSCAAASALQTEASHSCDKPPRSRATVVFDGLVEIIRSHDTIELRLR